MADLDPRWEPSVRTIQLSREYYEELLTRERELIEQNDLLLVELARQRRAELRVAA